MKRCVLDDTGASGYPPNELLPGGSTCRDGADCASGTCVDWWGAWHRRFCAAVPDTDSQCGLHAPETTKFDDYYCYEDWDVTITCGISTMDCVDNLCDNCTFIIMLHV